MSCQLSVPITKLLSISTTGTWAEGICTLSFADQIDI